MSISNILVAFDGTPPAERAVKLASTVAMRYDAHVTGLYAHTLPASYAQFDSYLTAEALTLLQSHEKEAEAKTEARFMDLVKGEGVDARTDFFSVHGFPNDVLSDFARTYDICVVGQPTDEAKSDYYAPNPDQIALQSGRPVLVAPRHYETFAIHNGAVLAWDGKRAAARALSDAMTFLERRHKLTVLHVGDEDEVRQPGRDIMVHLSRHGLEATLSCQPKGNMSIADIVLNTCAESDAGLLVMGAYEHSRFSEMLLGGVTRDVLSRTHIPILMSH